MTRLPGRPRRILIVALDNLGDLVFASALTPPLHAAFPDASIDVWCKQYTAPIAPLMPHVKRVIGADPFWAVPPHLERPRRWPFIRSIARIRSGAYDVALVTGAPWRTAAAVAATRIPMRIGLARNHNAHFLTHVLPPADPDRPVLEEQARLLGPLGVEAGSPRYCLDGRTLDPVRAQVRPLLDARFVALHPFASDRARCVALPEWIAVAHHFVERGLGVLWMGTTRELAEIRVLADRPPAVYADQLAGGSLTESAAALSLASLFIGHDSGPLHIAAAFGVPVVGIYAPGQPRRTFPQGNGPATLIARPSPNGITASTMLDGVDALFSRA